MTTINASPTKIETLCSDCQYKPVDENGLCLKCIGIRARLKKKPNLAYHFRLKHKGSKKNPRGQVPDRFVCNLNHRSHHRAGVLKDMGFTSYNLYLKSDLWKSIRRRVMERDEYLCQACKRPGLVVHHMDYDAATMEGETLDQLVTMCKHCHDGIEKRRFKLLKQARKKR